jgi:hypothetical protein
MEKMSENIITITQCYEKFEKFILDEIDSDLIMLQDINY